MSQTQDFDHVVAAWLHANGPVDIRPAAVDHALGVARSSAQRRGLRLALTGPAPWPTYGRRIGFATLPAAVRIALVLVVTLAILGAAAAVGSRLLRPTQVVPRLTYDDAFDPIALEVRDKPGSVVVLADGRVLASTDVAGNAVLQIWDPTTPAPILAGPMLAYRLGPALVVLQDSRVLIVGGEYVGVSGPAEISTAELFDPATGASRLTGPMVVSRYEPGVVRLLDGRVLVAGGMAPPAGLKGTAEAEVFDPATERFAPVGSMTTSGHFPRLALLPDGRVLALTPTSEEVAARWTADLYDPETGRFSPIAAPNGVRTGPITTLADGRIFLAHGWCIEGGPQVQYPANSAPIHAELYDPAAGGFVAAPDLPHCIRTATGLPNGQVLVSGYWYPGPSSRTQWTGLYDPTTGQIQLTADPSGYMPRPTLLADGRVLFTSPDGYWAEVFRCTAADRGARAVISARFQPGRSPASGA
jgi:hypothetical protein